MRNRRLITLSVIVAASLTLVGCGAVRDAGPEVSQSREIEGVTAVSLETSGSLTITTGADPALTIRAGRRVIDQLTSDVRDGELVLSTKRPRFGTLGTITYELVLPAVEEIRVSGSGEVEADLTATDTLEVAVAGSGDVMARGVEVDTMTVKVSGSGSVDLTGRAKRQAVQISGSGELSAHDLDSEDAQVSISGSGRAEVEVSGTLAANVSGSGSITHSGGAKVTGHVSGSGHIDEE